MGDTQLFGTNLKVTGVTKAMLLYVLVDMGSEFVTAMATMDRATWEAMWWMPRVAFWLGPVVSAGIVIKAFYSNSSK